MVKTLLQQMREKEAAATVKAEALKKQKKEEALQKLKQKAPFTTVSKEALRRYSRGARYEKPEAGA